MEKFESSENRCREINEKFCFVGLNFSFLERSILERARSEIKRILRVFSWDAAMPFLSHGPGATFGSKRDRGHPWYKFGDKQPTVTGECLALTHAFIEACPLIRKEWENNAVDPKVVRGSKVTTVPKDARSDRVIAIEPQLNMFFQKGIGGLMRSRLKQAGCDLNDQTINQRLALLGSREGNLATIDLASASDSISRSLVEFLIPEDWLVALKACRSARSLTSKGDFLFLQKFSSMGNGYTFELESLIFLSLARAVASLKGERASDCSVYGDDIVVPCSIAGSLISILDACGFSTNVEKSFVDGPFRESCGKHYFLGRDVTPFYLKKKVKAVDECFHLVNSIRRLAFRLNGLDYGCHVDLHPAYAMALSLVDRRYLQYSVPEGYGDGGILRDFDEVCPRPKPAQGWVEGYRTSCLSRKYNSFDGGEWPALLWRLSDLERRSAPSVGGGMGTRVPLRVYKLKAVKLSVQRWVSLGPWVG
jgi:hypothetical protein